jgi:carbamoyltransferase
VASDAQKGSLLGPAFSADEIRAVLDAAGATYEHIPDEDALCDRVAGLMAEQNVIGFMQGRMEYGPRALGSRSILGDARSDAMQTVMNLKIKFRESFRPFAPSVLRERVDHYFQTRPEEDSPYTRRSRRSPTSTTRRGSRRSIRCAFRGTTSSSLPSRRRPAAA